jgi:hypothetical protein
VPVRWAGNRFLGSFKGLQIRALLLLIRFPDFFPSFYSQQRPKVDINGVGWEPHGNFNRMTGVSYSRRERRGMLLQTVFRIRMQEVLCGSGSFHYFF